MICSSKIFKNNFFFRSSIDSANLTNDDKITNLKKFCKELTKEEELVNEVFYEFFEIPDMFRETVQFDYRKTEITDMSFSLKELGDFGEDKKGWKEFHKEDTSKYCLYFKVALKNILREPDYYLFSFEFKSLIHQDLVFRVDKRYSEFTSFVALLKKKCRARPPTLPQKMLIHEKDMIEKRGRNLKNWLSVIVNERMFHCKDLFEFMGLPEKWTGDYLLIHPLNFLYNENEVNLAITGYENIKGEDNSETFI